MQLKQKNVLKILKYKYLFEELNQVDAEYKEGSIDLNYRLSFFRSKLEEKNQEGQAEVYDSVFLGKKDDKNLTLSDVDLEDDDNETIKNKVNIEDWAKKLYRKIALLTHPDKTKGLGSQPLIEKLTTQYRIAQEAYSQGKKCDIIMVAHDLSIEIPEDIVEKEIAPNILEKQKQINEKKGLLGWTWYHVPDVQKDAELKKILLALGFTFTEEKVKEAIRSKLVKRKVGTRPKKMNFKNRKLK